jgi:hypothetical protein
MTIAARGVWNFPTRRLQISYAENGDFCDEMGCFCNVELTIQHFPTENAVCNPFCFSRKRFKPFSSKK